MGLDGLPNFDQLGAEGHHYDVESGPYRFAMSLFSPTLNTLFRFPEFFLHHEGMIDSTRTISDPSDSHDRTISFDTRDPDR